MGDGYGRIHQKISCRVLLICLLASGNSFSADSLNSDDQIISRSNRLVGAMEGQGRVEFTHHGFRRKRLVGQLAALPICQSIEKCEISFTRLKRENHQQIYDLVRNPFILQTFNVSYGKLSNTCARVKMVRRKMDEATIDYYCANMKGKRETHLARDRVVVGEVLMMIAALRKSPRHNRICYIFDPVRHIQILLDTIDIVFPDLSREFLVGCYAIGGTTAILDITRKMGRAELTFLPTRDV